MKLKSPYLALTLLTAVNLLNYLDRYILASLLPYVSKDFSLSDFQLGLIGAAFILPYILISPFFGVVGDRLSKNSIASVAVAIWSVATMATGFASSFGQLIFTRFILGLGESAFSVTSPAWLNDFFPGTNRGRALAFFSAALPIGAAIGFIAGGVLGDPVGGIGWRKTLMLVGVPGLLLAGLIWFLVDPKTESEDQEDETGDDTAKKAFIQAAREWLALLRLPRLRATIFGYAAYTFVVGGLAHWMPLYMDRYQLTYRQMPTGVVFGLIALVAGLIGTFSGGALADYIDRRFGKGYIKVSAYSTWASLPFFLVMSQTGTPNVFFGSLFITMTLLFMSTSPISLMIFECVPQTQRSAAMALAIFTCHFLGDALSSPMIGYVSDLTDELSTGVFMMTPVLLTASIFWTLLLARFWQLDTSSISFVHWPFLISHRGYLGFGARENSIQSVRDAARAGFTAVEFDLRMSQDGVLFMYHDGSIPGLGKVRKLPSDAFHSVGIDSFRDFLKSRPTSPMSYNFELKPDLRKKQLISAFLKDIDTYAPDLDSERIIVSSFDPLLLAELKRQRPSYLRAALISNWWQWSLASMARPQRLHLYDGFYDKIGPRIKKLNAFIAVWTVNEVDAVLALEKYQVHGVITDSVTPSALSDRGRPEVHLPRS